MRAKPNLYFTILSFALLVMSCQLKEGKSDKDDSELLFSAFVDPPNHFRSHPFYSINDSLTEEGITTQIKDFRQAGFGGFYLHSRSGLITEFLGDDWWKIMQASVDAANKEGLRCMFYDEDKWPSGFAGGIVPLMSEDYRAKCLVRLDTKTPFPLGAEKIGEDSISNYMLYTSQLEYDIFNGTCYVDLFSPEAVRAFIDVSYKPYAEKYRSQIRNYTPAIFSDEPHIHARYFDKKTPHLGTLSYSPWLEKKFQNIYDYNLRDKLELLYEEKDNWREVRMHYYRTKALLFEESYTRQLAAFCGENHMDYTGHYLAEDVLQKVRDRAGNTMLHYRSMQQPGMDMLGLGFKGKIITARNLSSVANQFGKEKRLSELFGISGQNMNFEDRKWIAGWHAINGVNHFCPHLTLYSMKGHRKRDYPPTFSYQQPYWEYNKKLEDYLGRIAMATTIGKYNPQILVISPLESEYIKGKSDREFTSGMLSVLQGLQNNHYDYDIGDEQIMADTAVVKDGKLIIGEMSYSNVILPDMISIRKKTVELLLELKKQGGLLINTGRFPAYLDGKRNDTLLEQFQKEVIFLNDTVPFTDLHKRVEPSVKITGEDADQIWTQTRIIEGGKLIQLFNTSHTEAIRIYLMSEFPGGDIVLWDPSDTKCYRLRSNDSGEYTIELRPSSNIWITSGTFSKGAVTLEEYTLPAETSDLLILDQKWKGKRLSPNALTLDFARYSTDGKNFSQPEPVIGIFNRLSDQQYSGKLILRYPLEVETVPKSCSLAVEQPEQFTSIKINSKAYNFDDRGYYADHYFRLSEITNWLDAGKNTIDFELDFEAPEPLSPDPKTRYGTEIESIYIVGDFAVKANMIDETYDTQRNNTGNFIHRPVYEFTSFTLTDEKSEFKGELSAEGYPFFAGSFKITQNITLDAIQKDKHYMLEIPNSEMIASIISINDNIVDTLVWAPFQTELTPYLKAGVNKVSITLVNSLRNLLGPHHHKKGELTRVGPNSFTGLGGFPDGRGEKDWYDTRLKNENNPIWTDSYMHIPFGLLEPVKITIQDN